MWAFTTSIAVPAVAIGPPRWGYSAAIIPDSPPARIERDGPLATLVIDHPPLNLFGEELTGAIGGALEELERSDARALVIRAEGKVFTGGADVHGFEGLDTARGAELLGGGLEIIHRLESLPIPTLSVVHALCLTAGLELSLGCDMIWAAESAKFGLVEAVVGLTPGWGGTQRMAERAGVARAREFVMSGGLYDAQTLERWGVVNRVLPDEELLPKATEFARGLANGPTKAHAATKAVLRAFLEGGLPEADRRTPATTASLWQTEDLRNAVRSFLDQGPGKATFDGK
jgi:enoyl-CoA hydratase